VSVDPDLQRRINALLATPGEGSHEGVAPAFSPFFGDGAARAGRLAAELREAASGGDLERAVAAAEEAAQTEPAGLVKRAVKVFVTHEPLAAGRLELPTVEVVESKPVGDAPPPSTPPPGGALPSGIPGAPPRAGGGGSRRLEAAPPPEDRPDAEDSQELPSLTEPPAERAIDWYREDPFANDHHAHWHIVYPRDGSGPETIQRRHGELFFYMHQQMLARYDTERVIAGLGRVVPHPPSSGGGAPNYTAAIPEGYGSRGYTRRRASRSFAEIPDAVEECSAWHRRLSGAIESGQLHPSTGRLTETQLGSAAEAAALNTGARVIDVDTVEQAFGNLHGSGHGHAGALGEGPDPLGWGGAMWWTETAICDPFFYRWHKHIDDLYASFQEASGETNDPATHAPEGISFDGARSIVLCLSSDIPGADAPSFDFDGFARERLGEDLDGADELLTTELPTRFVRSRVTAGIPGRERVTYTTTHLVHEPFTYFIRLENAAGEPREVTVRSFLAHATLAHDRRAWIELDKFAVNVARGVTVLGRPDARSSVIKRRGVTAAGAEPLADGAVDQWCDCGWPYSLLLPSGASDGTGTPFTLMVALTDHRQDREPDHVRTCGSMSYCGALENYPDRRRMGYPFDRPFAGTIADTIAASPSMTSTGVTIRCQTLRPPE
jgi:tyrosinase